MTENNHALARSATANRIITDLRLKIILQKYKPQDRLIETDLTKEYHASRTSIRTAFQALESEGMIKFLPNGGKEVVGFSKKYASDLYDVREMLECQAVEITIRDPLPDYRPLLEVLDLINRYMISGENTSAQIYSDLDIQFHRAILRMAHNIPLMQSWETTSSVMLTLLNLNRSEDYNPRYVNELYMKHKQIIDSVITKDPKVLDILHTHIVDAKEITLNLLEKLWD